MNAQKKKAMSRQRKRFRVRKSIRGTAERPRLSVFRSSKHIYAQVIDDAAGKTLASASSIADEIGYGGNAVAAAKIGALIAERAKAAGVAKVCFDRGHNKYHGRIKALADAAREGGIQF